ncbi:hypothetical protein BH18ACT17_BH18ACT17_00280 [soil metagenome]
MHDLTMSPKEMRALGHRVVDLLVDLVSDGPSLPPIRTATREQMEGRLAETPPNRPADVDVVLERLVDDVLAFSCRWDHPAFFGYVPGTATWPGALGDLIASALNVDAAQWRESAGPVQLELVVLDWFKEWIGYTAEAGGVLASGGSAANMTALACAREAMLGPMDDRAVVYLSDQAHSSLARAARALGFRPDRVRILPADSEFRMRPEQLETMIRADRRAGLVPLVVAGAAGSTSTGAVDPLSEMASVCRDQEVWLHIDAAYGGFSVLTERGRARLEGVHLADSITLDPHKWLYQPFECGALLVRDGSLLERAFQITPHYLKDAEGHGREVNLSDRGLQLTRVSHAIKVWLSIQLLGLDAFRSGIDRSLDLAAAAQGWIERSEALELVTPAWLSIVTFRRRVPGALDEGMAESANAELIHRLVESGQGFVSSTRLHGRYVMRMCVLNPSSTTEHVERVLSFLASSPLPRSTPSQLTHIARRPEASRETDVRLGWLGSDSMKEHMLEQVPLFRDLDADLRRLIVASAYERVLAPAEIAVERWTTSREFFVVLTGSVDVVVDEEVRDRLEPGEFFGEIAALDWGAEYGYPRLATVVAAEATRLLAVPGSTLDQLVRRSPSVRAAINEAIRERLPGL